MLITETESVEEATEALLDICPGVFAITLGKEGTLLGLAGKTYIIPSIPVKPVDTTGAGDAFAVGVLSALLEGRPVAEAVARGNWCGSRAVQSRGDMEGLPLRHELEAYDLRRSA